MGKIPIILLAAGASSRMGTTKSLLSWGTTTLIRHQINLIKSLGEVNVVLGAYSKNIVPTIEDLPINILVNSKWEEGMGCSIAYGVNSVLVNTPDIDGVLIILVDQPLIPLSHYKNLLETFEKHEFDAVTSKSHSGWEGVPVVFGKMYFDKLLQLEGEQGAKRLLASHKGKITSVDAGNTLRDMDTIQAYKELHGIAFGRTPE